jgi:predicted phosphodiesterase
MPNLYSIKGNHDKYYLDSLNDSELKSKLVANYGDSYNYKADTEELDYINKMADHLELSIDGKNLVFFHGGPDNFLEQRIYPDSVLKLCGYEDKFDYIFTGHTHYKMTRHCGKATIVNPGSLGQPRDTMFSYCTFDTLTDKLTFKSAEIDIEKILTEVKERDGNMKNGRYLLHKYGGLV